MHSLYDFPIYGSIDDLEYSIGRREIYFQFCHITINFWNILWNPALILLHDILRSISIISRFLWGDWAGEWCVWRELDAFHM